jgi:hypothetical protein
MLDLMKKKEIKKIYREQEKEIEKAKNKKNKRKKKEISETELENKGKEIIDIINKAKNDFENALREIKGKNKELKKNYLENLKEIHEQHFNFIKEIMEKYLQKNGDYIFVYNEGKVKEIKTKTYYNVGKKIKNKLKMLKS